MLIKEYRIPLPLSVEEYRIAQLYMIAKKSREETQGAGSGVEILVNEPYVDDSSGKPSGQYTKKIYHIGHHLPGWLKALLPKSVLTVEEEAWNAYPYTRTRYTCPFVEKFFIEIETKYFNDPGCQDNVFDLSNSELRSRTVDVIDIVKDQLYGSDYVKEEDPTFYVSAKTQRGPLSENWVEEHASASIETASSKAIMCAYKLCRVEFKYWGMQSKIEKFIHDSALRRVMLRAHRQAWAWQDEWLGLTMEDIRRLEKETQEALAQKMAKLSCPKDEECEDSQVQEAAPKSSSFSSQGIDFNIIDKDKDEELGPLSMAAPKSKSPLLPSKSSNANVVAEGLTDQVVRGQGSRNNSKTEESIKNFDVQLANWRMESIVNDSDTSSNEEFFDAEDVGDSHSLTKWSSLECVPVEDLHEIGGPENEDSIFSSSFIHRMQVEHSRQHVSALMARRSLDTSLPNSPTASPGRKVSHESNTLILVIHGGNILDSGAEPLTNKKSDFTTFRGAFESLVRQHYPAMVGKISFRLVPCPPICADALAVLSSLSPYSFHSSPSAIDGVCHSYDSVPLGSLPLFAIASQDYSDAVSKVIASSNHVYQEFLKTEEGAGFNGPVVLIGDSIGSVVTFDALCHASSLSNSSRFGSETSIDEAADHEGHISSSAGKESKAASSTAVKTHPQISVSGGDEVRPESEETEESPSSRGNSLNSKPLRKSQSRLTEECCYNRFLCAPLPRRRSSGSSDHNAVKFDFDVGDFFMFGSPLGLALTFRKMMFPSERNFLQYKPNCSQAYNLFHPTDPSVLRLEPLLSARFSYIPPVNIPRMQKILPKDEATLNLVETLQLYSHVFAENQNSTHNYSTLHRRLSETSVTSNVDIRSLPNISSLLQKWWGTKRLDYALYCPDGLTNFPTHSLPHLFHASYWESSDVISFIIRQLLRVDVKAVAAESEKEPMVLRPSHSTEKWLRKRTSMKLKNVNPNHRANDVIVKEGADQTISARFMYGPLDVVALTGERVDVYIMKDMLLGEWTYLSTVVTDKSGRVSYTIPTDRALGYGMYPVKMVVRGDHTYIDFFLTVVPPKTEGVVFSIDGSFTASVSVTGRDPKVRAGAVDVVRYWQELGYLIIYVTGRPDMQQQKVISWLSQHNFPHGLVSFADRLSTDPLKHKMEFLKHLQTDAEIVIHAAYGSSKDIWVYHALGLQPDQIFIVGKASKKHQIAAHILNDGYAAHLSKLNTIGVSRPAKGNARMIFPRGCIGLLGHGGFCGVRQKRSAKRTTSYPLPNPCVQQSQSVEEASSLESNPHLANRPGSNKSK